MIAAEQCFCEMNNSPVRKVRGRVELYNGSTLLETFKHTDKLKSFTIERVGANSKFFGFGIVHKLNVKVLDKDRTLNITTANTLDIAFGIGCDFIYCYPLFRVSEVHRDETTNELSITAYDVLYQADKHLVSEMNMPHYYTIEGIARECATFLGIPVNIISDGFDITYPDGANLEGSEKVKELLDAIAEATQTIYYLNNDNALTFKRLDVGGEAVSTITKEHYFSLDSGENRRLAAITHTTQLGDNLTAALSISGTTQYVRDNPLWEMRDDTELLVDAALANIGGITINQFTCNWRGNYLLEIGDKISLITKDNANVISYLLDDVINYDGSLSQKTQWKYENNEAETAANPTNLGDALKQTYAKVDKVEKSIDIVVSDVAANASEIAALTLEKDSIKATVSNMETQTNTAISSVNNNISTLTQQVEAAMTAEAVKISIKEELSNGVDKILTTTGYSFDADGLRVSKSGSEMESVLDEDGLSVYRDNTEVLTADNTGVNGINMTVRQYLIIGGSRFEAYGGRTGCFWVGG